MKQHKTILLQLAASFKAANGTWGNWSLCMLRILEWLLHPFLYYFQGRNSKPFCILSDEITNMDVEFYEDASYSTKRQH